MDTLWLESLRVGDEVCYKTRWHGYSIVKIIKITPTKQIKTDDGRTFKNGSCKVDSWEWINLEPVTMNVRNYILKKELVNKLVNVKWRELPLEKLLMVNAIISDCGPKGIGSTESPSNAGAE